MTMAGTSLKTEEYPLVSKTQNYLFQIFFDGFWSFQTHFNYYPRAYSLHSHCDIWPSHGQINFNDFNRVQMTNPRSFRPNWTVQKYVPRPVRSNVVPPIIGAILDNYKVTWNPMSSKDFEPPICGHQMTVDLTTRPSTDTSSAYMDTS